MKKQSLPSLRFLNNPLCKLFGMRYPIILGGMLYAGKARLAASVSKAGGLGILGAGRMRPDYLVAEIEKTAALTDQPFGVNIPLRGPDPGLLIDASLGASVKIFVTSGGSPAEHVDRIKATGAKIIQVVASVRQALSAQAVGVDAVVAEGCESGGIASRDLLSTLVLVPQVVDSVQIPVIAAGGIADGRGMAAAFALGALGIQMGTRFLSCAECEIPANYKQAVVMARDTDTWVFRNASGVGCRILKKKLVQQACESQDNGSKTIINEAPMKNATDSNVHADASSYPAYSAGQSAGLIREVLPASEIIQRILTQADSIAESLRQWD